MRVMSLHIIFLFTFIATCPAFAADRQQSSCCGAGSVSEIFGRHSSISIFSPPSRLSHDGLGFLVKPGVTPEPLSVLYPSRATVRRGNPVCLVIDTYTVAKEDADSDSTVMVGRSRCSAASKFRVDLSNDPQRHAVRNTAACPEDGETATWTGQVKRGLCEYAHDYIDSNGHGSTHAFFEDCGKPKKSTQPTAPGLPAKVDVEVPRLER